MCVYVWMCVCVCVRASVCTVLFPAGNQLDVVSYMGNLCMCAMYSSGYHLFSGIAIAVTLL